jgi:hypothetical protein
MCSRSLREGVVPALGKSLFQHGPMIVALTLVTPT